MLKVTFWHEPDGFQFYIQDPVAEIGDIGGERIYNELTQRRFVCGSNIAIICVVSEFSEIPVTVQYDQIALKPENFDEWDRVIEFSLETESKEIVFASCPDGPIYGRFGTLEVNSGCYRLRLYYGGQNTVQPDGTTSDYYLVQIWPDEMKGSEILKPMQSSIISPSV